MIAKQKKPFTIVFNSDINLGDSVVTAKLNLAAYELIMNVQETKNYDWMNWLLNIPEKEVITLFLANEEGSEASFLIDNLLVLEHECTLNQENLLGIDLLDKLAHKITVGFHKAERLTNKTGQ